MNLNNINIIVLGLNVLVSIFTVYSNHNSQKRNSNYKFKYDINISKFELFQNTVSELINIVYKRYNHSPTYINGIRYFEYSDVENKDNWSQNFEILISKYLETKHYLNNDEIMLIERYIEYIIYFDEVVLYFYNFMSVLNNINKKLDKEYSIDDLFVESEEDINFLIKTTEGLLDRINDLNIILDIVILEIKKEDYALNRMSLHLFNSSNDLYKDIKESIEKYREGSVKIRDQKEEKLFYELFKDSDIKIELYKLVCSSIFSCSLRMQSILAQEMIRFFSNRIRIITNKEI